jgi:hypothetical protein
MKYKILGLVGLVWGAGVVHHSYGTGLTTATPYEAGSTIAFGFGVLLILAGGSALWDELNGREASLGGRALLFVLLAAAVTIVVLKLSPAKHPSESQCDEALQNYRAIVVDWDPDGSYTEQFDDRYGVMMTRCRRGTFEQYRCVLEAESQTDVDACP